MKDVDECWEHWTMRHLSDEAITIRVYAEGGADEILTGRLQATADLPVDRWRNLGQALLRSDVDDLTFHWPGRRGLWSRVTLRAERMRRKPAVLLEIRIVLRPFGLSKRELEIVTYVAAGYGNENIAVHLGINRRTVEKHLENVFQKTDIWTRAGLAGFAVEHGLLIEPSIDQSCTTTLNLGVVFGIAQRSVSKRPPIRRVERHPITIGMPLPLNGFGRADALEMRDGAQLAINRLNEEGGVLDRQLKLLTVECDITDPNVMKRSITELAEMDVAAITAGYSIAEADVLRIASDYKAPFLHAATLDHVVNWVREDPGRFSNIFQTCASDINYGPGLARFLSRLVSTGQWAPQNRRIAVVQPPWLGLDIGLDALYDGLEGRTWDIVPVVSALAANRQWSDVIAEIERINPSVVLLATYLVEDSIAFQKAFVAARLPVLLYKLYSPSIPTYREALGADAEGVVWATTTGLYSDAIGQDFQTRFQRTYGRRAGRSQAGIAYDRINLLAGAWSRVGNAHSYGDVVADLRTNIHRGVNGAYSFGKEGQVGLTFPDDTQDPSISQAHLVFQIQNGRQRIISPPPYAEAAFRLPSWIPKATLAR